MGDGLLTAGGDAFVVVAEHRAVNLAKADYGAFNENLVCKGGGESNRVDEFLGCVNLGNTNARAEVGRLYNSGQADFFFDFR